MTARPRAPWPITVLGTSTLLLAACNTGAITPPPSPPAPPPAPTVASIVLTPATARLKVGGAPLALTATVEASTGAAVSPAPDLTWTVNEPDRASVSADGQVTGLSTGVVSVTASAAGITSNSVQLTVLDERVVSISVAGTANLAVGDRAAFAATARNRDGKAVSSQPDFTWTSSDEDVLALDAQGGVTAVGPGSAEVVAQAGATRSSPVTVTVTGPPGPHAVGRWSEVVPWPALAVHATLMPDGSVVTFGWRKSDPYKGYDPDHGPGEAAAAQPSTLVDRWNPATGTHSTTWETNVDLFGAGHDLLPDGRLLVSGGTAVGPDWAGIKDNRLLSAQTGAWSAAAPMRFARWYPSATTLPNGEVLVSEGIDEAGRNVGTYEVWNPASNTWRSLDGAVRSLDYAYYPFMHVTLDGRVMKTGPLPDMAFLNTSGNGQWTSASTRDGTSRKYGSSVPFAPGKALVVGGGEVDGTATAMVVDLNTGNATATGSMRQARRNLNAVVLPTGAVLAVGGNGRKNDEGSLPLSAELWDPSTGQWSELAEMSVPRPYHSTALLLPDGRVFASGGYDAYKGASRYRNAEFFSPPYLFKRDGSGQLAARPVISSVPDSLNYASSVDVASPDAATVAKVALIRLGSTTHAFDFSQRYVPLEFNKGTGALRVTTPQNANLAPPGYYMLFVVNAAGVPSVARIVRLG